MNISTLVGSFGVSLLLLAFFLNLFRFTTTESRIYMLLNIVGAGISCYASVLITYWPFIILEACWCGVALVAFVKKEAGL